MKIAFIIRGVSGAGKSTLAETLINISRDNMLKSSCSADNYMVENGEYKFSQDKLKECHAECLRDWHHACENGYGIVIVHNTFTRKWEYKDYVQCAKYFGYELHIITVENHHGNKSIHNVPENIVKAQHDRFEHC